jgi:diadenosine tetraphosphate (Ap4A) HIT family hydrolase
MAMSCFICDKHSELSSQPPGGYIYEDEHWMVCHFPTQQAVLGQLVIESRRHFLDFSDMTEEEARSYGILVKRLYSALKQVTGAERVYSVVLLEGIPHFHAHLVPRSSDSPAKGVQLLA